MITFNFIFIELIYNIAVFWQWSALLFIKKKNVPKDKHIDMLDTQLNPSKEILLSASTWKSLQAHLHCTAYSLFTALQITISLLVQNLFCEC